MKRLSLFAAFFVAVSCFGQSIGQTTLAVGASPTDTTITLVSSAGVSAAAGTTVVTGLFIEHEYIEVQTNGGTNVWTVRRAAGGFRGPHLAGTTVYVGRPFDFGVGVTNSRTNPKGNCVAGAQALPYVVIATGDVFTCPTTGANAGIWTLLTPAGSVVTEDVSGNVTVPGNLNFLGNIYRNGTLFSGTWGGIGGTLSAQTDLWTALSGKQATIAGAPGTWPLSFTPSAHASTHQNGGTDEIATATPAANAIPKAGSGGTLAVGWIPTLNYQAPITGAPGTWPTLTNTVFGRSGAVTAQNGDYTTTQVTEGTNLYFTVLRAQAAISISGSYLGYTGGVLSVSGLQPTITGAPGTWPSFATVATSGSYTDLSNKPTIAAASSTTPLMDGTAAIGSAATYAKADHVHPTDTSRQATIAGAPGTWPSTFAPTAHASTHAGAGSDPITSLGAITMTGALTGVTAKLANTADSSVNLLVTGLTKAVRIGSSTGAANIDGVDPTGTASYQPLQLNGSFVSFGNSGTEVLRATGNAVGIGTTGPDGTLHVAGTTQITWSTSPNTALAVIGSRGTVGGSLWVNTPSLGASYPSGLGVQGTYASSISTVQLGAYGTYSGGPYGSVLSFLTTNQTVASEKMRIDQNGNVGIGVTPGAPLEVNNNGVTTGSYILKIDGTTVSGGFIRQAGNVSINAYAANLNQVVANGSNDLNLFNSNQKGIDVQNTTGFVGIGTTSPGYPLDVSLGVGLSGTARFYDQTATTGATLVVITPGASQTASSTVLSVGGTVKFGGTNSTGSGSALLGANSPATVVSAPYTWIKAIASDGTTVFLPAWK